jgi:hypothetical protein
MNAEQLKALLADMGAIITDSHVVYTDGGHGRQYIAKDRLCLDPVKVSLVCEEMASRIFRRLRELKEEWQSGLSHLS